MQNTFDELEPQYYVMDPSTDDLLPSGKHLKDGMIVLIDYPNFRSDISKPSAFTEMEEERAHKYNRWCKVSDIEYSDDEDTPDGIVGFVGTYSDDTKRKIMVATAHAWFVKKSSIPDDESLPSVRELVHKAYSAGAACYVPETADAILEEVSRGIVELFRNRRDEAYLETIRMMRVTLNEKYKPARTMTQKLVDERIAEYKRKQRHNGDERKNDYTRALAKAQSALSNLTTEMTLQGASAEEMARALRHSMVFMYASRDGFTEKAEQEAMMITKETLEAINGIRGIEVVGKPKLIEMATEIYGEDAVRSSGLMELRDTE